jgi:hypothetical protein
MRRWQAASRSTRSFPAGRAPSVTSTMASRAGVTPGDEAAARRDPVQARAMVEACRSRLDSTRRVRRLRDRLSRPPRLYTIGHTTRTYAQLVQILRAWKVTTLVDIRHFTRSRANPQFNATTLTRRLARDGIEYVVMTELGGRRGRSRDAAPARNAGWDHASFKNYADYAETPAFEQALAGLLARAATTTCAIMCAEAVWWRCHRRIVADYALTRGRRVFHIFDERKAQRATRTPFARLDRRTRTLRYPRTERESGRPRPSSRPPEKSARRATRRHGNRAMLAG